MHIVFKPTTNERTYKHPINTFIYLSVTFAQDRNRHTVLISWGREHLGTRIVPATPPKQLFRVRNFNVFLSTLKPQAFTNKSTENRHTAQGFDATSSLMIEWL